MKTEFTPGPWGYSKCQCGHPVCHSYHINHSRSNGGFDEADARLIAVAPDIFSALETIIKMIGPYAGQGRMDAEISAARAALAKATGHD